MDIKRLIIMIAIITIITTLIIIYFTIFGK